MSFELNQHQNYVRISVFPSFDWDHTVSMMGLILITELRSSDKKWTNWNSSKHFFLSLRFLSRHSRNNSSSRITIVSAAIRFDDSQENIIVHSFHNFFFFLLSRNVSSTSKSGSRTTRDPSINYFFSPKCALHLASPIANRGLLRTRIMRNKASLATMVKEGIALSTFRHPPPLKIRSFESCPG